MTPELGKSYWVERGGRRTRGTCKALTNLQALIELEDQDDEVWVVHSLVVAEAEPEASEKAIALELVQAATVMLQRAAELMTKGD